MRISPRLLLVPALLLAPATPRPAAAQDAPGIVFTAQRMEDGSAIVEPVLLLNGDALLEPMWEWSDSAVATFNARWLQPGRRYGLFARGERIGEATVVAPEEQGCAELLASATLAMERRLPAEWEGLAAHGLPQQAGAPWLRDANAAEKRALDRMAAALFEAHGIDVAARTVGDTTAATLLVGGNARPVLVGTYRLRTDEPVFRQAALMVVAEEGRNGYRPAYTWFHEGVVDDVESRRLVDAADLDGDGMPELILQAGYYESWDFRVVMRTEAGWRQVYHGGGGGC